MPSRSLARPAALCAATAFVLASAAAWAKPPKQPEVPPVAEIPVAPLPAPKKKADPTPAPQSPSTTTTTVTTTTVTAPALAAVATEAAPEPPAGVREAMPAPPPARILLVDEAPFKAGQTRALEQPEHEHGRKGHRKGRHGRPFHPAPGIVVEVTSAQGGAGAADLQRAARNVGYWPFRRCYEEGLRRNQQLSGSVSFELGKQSGESATQLSESTIRDESVTQCVLREARHLELPWGDNAGETMADVKVSLSTGDEPVPTPHVVPHADELREALHASWPAVQQCYAGELSRRPDAGGRMELRFRAKSSGEILEVSEQEEPRFGDVDVTRCVLGVYRTAKLPKLHGSHAGSFVYALHFESAPAPAR
jgi:hypothetical protein